MDNMACAANLKAENEELQLCRELDLPETFWVQGLACPTGRRCPRVGGLLIWVALPVCIHVLEMEGEWTWDSFGCSEAWRGGPSNFKAATLELKSWIPPSRCFPHTFYSSSTIVAPANMTHCWPLGSYLFHSLGKECCCRKKKRKRFGSSWRQEVQALMWTLSPLRARSLLRKMVGGLNSAAVAHMSAQIDLWVSFEELLTMGFRQKQACFASHLFVPSCPMESGQPCQLSRVQ